MSDKPVTVLLIDDDDVDIRVVERAFKQHKISNPIVVANDGVEGLARLRGEEGFERVKDPVLVLLDLNMPRMGGHEFLAELRSDPRLARTVVFILTTSSDERDRAAAYDRNVAGYLVKSEAGKDLMNHLPLLEHYMLSVHFPADIETSSVSNSDREVAPFV